MTFDLFADLPAQPSREPITEGAVLLRAFAAAQARELLQAIELVIAQSPLRHMQTPGGFRMSVAMSNCGQYGWVTDRRGYRYQHEDPLSGQAWPAMPPAFAQLAASATQEAGFADFAPDACLVNRYEPGARMSLHQDKNELDMAQPIVSLSLGLPATFLFGGMERSERPRRMRLDSGDVVVWGGPARLLFHGVDPLAEGEHPLTGRCRYNLTFRRAR
ncbi:MULTISPECIES: DNA oxidative demethylase AlkB [unclassified Herbaspirillum]|uniref:DNA oxidative demethylase AlkB n=1 Tax=unclassified Herbaspirillum TaxID=2624150 RepID=UPI00114FFB55|nr:MULTISPECIES: DNA oxidative demethylase AlkB [unclassified Herbaspirillum]MBB5392127.1 alkylated DNA repair protein (DNA oxidative demethylase) [Herbaspirillum sp. SJZ102]TQK13584.1 alkylated DNA repair protein (DNA oxidative demethylase) [Herbaspirillum sp. SJZ130]TQK15587.1 alkylated DNA repair protein (DNA oxidative demethylase) [Herbaspirillum sp. SJZ106]